MGGGGGSTRSMPDEQSNQLEEYKMKAHNFREMEEQMGEAASALEVRGTALALSGILPPYYTLEGTLENIEQVLNSGASLPR